MSRYYFKTEEIITKQKQGYIDIEDEYTQVYDSVLTLSTKLKSLLDIQILLYLTKESNKTNIFNANELLINKIKKELKKEFTKQTFYNCLTTLSDAQLIVKLARGQYQINPLALWRSSQIERKEIIDSILESKEDCPKYIITNEKENIQVNEEPLKLYSKL